MDREQYKKELVRKVEDILVRVDQKLNDYKDDRVYPILVATLLEEYDYETIWCSGSSTDDMWFTFLDNLEREEDLMGMKNDHYHRLLKIKPYEYDHEFQGKLIELYCFMYDLTWDFIYQAWELHNE